MARLLGVTEKQATKAFTTERKASSVGDEVVFVMKGHLVAKGKVEALMAGEVIVTGAREVAAERERRAVLCAEPRTEFAKRGSTQ